MLHHRFAFLAALMLAVPSSVRAQDKASSQLAKLQAAVKKSKLGYQAKYAKYRPLFEDFAEKHEGTEDALTARLWLLQQTWWQRRAGTMEAAATKIADAILEKYPKSEQLAKIAEYHYVLPRKRKAEYFEKIGKMTPHDSVKAAMLFGRARYGGKKGAKALYRELRAKYGKLPYRSSTYAEMVDALLSPHKKADLAIGKPAPDIVGVDVDGLPMKLSDYRGKVIVLDFWGDW